MNVAICLFVLDMQIDDSQTFQQDIWPKGILDTSHHVLTSIRVCQLRLICVDKIAVGYF